MRPADATSWAAYIKNGGLLDIQALMSAELYFNVRFDIISLVDSKDPCKGSFRPSRPPCPVAKPYFTIFTLFHDCHYDSLVAVTPDPHTNRALAAYLLPFAVAVADAPAIAALAPCAPIIPVKQILGERLYALIKEEQPSLAGKITGMLLEGLDNAELSTLIIDYTALHGKIAEALEVLEAHSAAQKRIAASRIANDGFTLVSTRPRKRRSFGHTPRHTSSVCTSSNRFFALFLAPSPPPQVL